MNEMEITLSIKAKLSQIEARENIRIIYACESGSRAWGFASADSDYDVRFIFVRPVQDYLRVKELPDFIDAELNDVYDINGWDLKKFFKQLYKSNPVIFEWAGSPIVYRNTLEWEKVSEVMKDFIQDEKMLHHYKGMAKNNVRTNFCTSEVVLKKYLYVLRPVLACVWIMQKHTVPPTEFMSLVEEVLPSELRCIVDELLTAKMNGSEKQTGSRISELDLFIETKLSEASMFAEVNTNELDLYKLDNLFLEIIEE